VTPEGLAWELTFTTGTDARPTGLMVDMTEMIKQTNNLQVPEGYSFKIQYDFERWDVDTDLPAGIFEFKPPKDGQRFESLADYMVRDGAIGNHPLLGKPAPTFTARLFEGEEVTFEHDPDGKVVLLDFWATWCGPCVEALPELQQLAEKFKGKDVTFYAVNVNETPEAIGAFLQTHELSLPVLVDVEGQLTAAFRATAIPQTVLIGKGGRVEAVHVGFDAGKSMSILEKEIETLLAGRRIYQAEEIAEPVGDDESVGDGDTEAVQDAPEKVDKK
jgi:thiol-disulfide isomerase/thioredoxin